MVGDFNNVCDKDHRKRHISRVLVFLKGTTKRETDGQTLSDDVKVDINTEKEKKRVNIEKERFSKEDE